MRSHEHLLFPQTEISDHIMDSARAIEAEYLRTDNSWLACLNSRLFALETMLIMPDVEAAYGILKYQQIRESLQNLKTRVYQLTEQYPDKDSAMPTELKQELLDELESLIT